MTRTLRRHSLAVATALAVWPAFDGSQLHAQSLCQEIAALRPGESRTDHLWHRDVQAGVGWHRSRSGWTDGGAGPVREVGFSMSRLSTLRACTADEQYEITPLPRGVRVGLALSEGFWSELLAVSVHGGWLHTGPTLRWWIAPELTGIGVATDSMGIALGANGGVSLFEWVGVQLRPAYLVGGRGSYRSGFIGIAMITISPAFAREHFGDPAEPR